MCVCVCVCVCVYIYINIHMCVCLYICILAWRIPWTEGANGLQSTGCQRVGRTETTYHIHTYQAPIMCQALILAFGTHWGKSNQTPWKLHIINKQIVFEDDQCYDKRKEEEDEEKQRAGRREQVKLYMRGGESGWVSLWKWCFLVAKSWPTLCDPMDCSRQGSSVQGISKTRMLEPFPSPGDLPDPGMEPTSPASVGTFFIAEPPAKPETFQQRLEGCESMSHEDVWGKNIPSRGNRENSKHKSSLYPCVEGTSGWRDRGTRQ